jgi:hypothetical protein
MRKSVYATILPERTYEQVSQELSENYHKILELMNRQTELFTELEQLMTTDSK